ncbi:MAG: sortase [Candidatus Shapirobacteria bacterium]|nr:sortase [Candidatus Shapirobacteria bacterium]MDD4410603.1 sortase [Candidatus Shapirobacteria bacterium]
MLDFFRLVPKKRTVKIRSKKGIIFHNPSGSKKYFFYIGTGVFLTAIGYLVYLYWPLSTSIIVYNKQKNNKTEIVNIEKETETIVPIEEFSIRIPKILASAKIKANVSPFDKKEYLPILEQGIVAQAKNSSLPGQKDKAIYLFAHSTSQGVQMVRKNSVFYLLGELKNGDPIFINYNGRVYTYKVYAQKIVEAKEIEYLNYGEKDKEILILQTCWPLGTDWKRLLVFAERI